MSQTKHALIIEDDRMSAIVLEKLLSAEGVSASSINHPALVADALDQIVQPAVIFVDLELPVQNGYEVLDQLRARFGTEIPIVAYTVHISESVSALHKGFDGFIGKPVNRQDFPDHLRRILNGERVWAVS